MLQPLPRRKRLLLITGAISGVFILAIGITLWLISRPEPEYRPGEDIEGITAELARSLPPDFPRIKFVDVAQQAGIHFQHFYGTRTTQLPEDMGSGAAWGDYDNDGWVDLFVANEIGPLTLSQDEIKASPATSKLYHNNGDGTFTDVTEQAGVDLRGWAMAAAWGDYDNDGWLDLFISTYGENVLFHNNGDGTFTDQTRATGLGGIPGFWVGASWADYNRDGYLDLYVCGYVQYKTDLGRQVSLQYDVEVPASINPSSFEPERNLLYKNNGDGSFTEMAREAGVSNPFGRSLSATWCDFDEDGWPDLYVANDVSDNALFYNRGDGTFEDISHEAWVADYRGAMGLAVGDWDLDLDLDLFITHWIAQENALYNNMRSQFNSDNHARRAPVNFTDVADRYGLGQIALDYIGWGTSFFDYDNDSRPDLFVVNGSTFQQKEDPTRLIPMRDLLFWNRNNEEGFYEVSLVSGEVFRKKYVGRGAAFADFDNDGDIDIFVVNNGGPAQLLRNEGGNRNNWLQIHLKGIRSNPQAIGARLRLYAGKQVFIREVGCQSSYASQNSLIEHFGLGQITLVDSLQIIWPSGLHQVLKNLPVNQRLNITEPAK